MLTWHHYKFKCLIEKCNNRLKLHKKSMISQKDMKTLNKNLPSENNNWKTPTNPNPTLKIHKFQWLKVHTLKNPQYKFSEDNRLIKLTDWTLTFLIKNKAEFMKKESIHRTKIFRNQLFTNLLKNFKVRLETNGKTLKDHLLRLRYKIHIHQWVSEYLSLKQNGEIFHQLILRKAN